MVIVTFEEQITAAIGAHGSWKGKLRSAIDSGTYELSSSVIRDDHRCNFGKWLHDPNLSPAARTSKYFGNCVELHRRFHAAAADVVSLVEAGDRQNATKAMNTQGAFGKISSELTAEMMAWKVSLRQ
jgi:methyl-accepting chemotaxis protein